MDPAEIGEVVFQPHENGQWLRVGIEEYDAWTTWTAAGARAAVGWLTQWLAEQEGGQ